MLEWHEESLTAVLLEVELLLGVLNFLLLLLGYWLFDLDLPCLADVLVDVSVLAFASFERLLALLFLALQDAFQRALLSSNRSLQLPQRFRKELLVCVLVVANEFLGLLDLVLDQ